MIEISASILNVKKEESVKTFYNLETARIDYFHVDVMDGEFVKNDTSILMKEYINDIKQISNIPLDVHLMVKNVDEFVEEYLAFKPNIITVHVESVSNEEKMLDIVKKIKQAGSKIGISVKPKTQIDEIIYILPYIHQVLIMTVEPGEGGQKILPETIEKIKKLEKYIKENNLDIDIEVDGGINTETAKLVIEAGANILVLRNCNSKIRKL